MATFKNISDKVFIDGNITVRPNQVWTVNDPARIDQLTKQYSWQFKCVDGEVPLKPSNAPKQAQPTKSLSKMNKDELLTLAGELEVGADPEMTNKKLVEAIKAKQEFNNQ